jgi:pimeloyl-ACP methyl ester carboxylesterase
LALKKISYQNKDFFIHYEILNQDIKQDIIFLHGWGSNKEVMKQAFGKFFKNYRHLYIDMPGFGKSAMPYVLNTNDYAFILDIFLQTISFKKYIIVGHSFGGKVATLLNPDILVLLSSAGIVEKKPFLIRAKIRLFKALKLFGLGKFYHIFATKDVSGMEKNMYETLKNVVDEDFSTIFSNFGNKAFIFWGKEDKATSLISGKQIASLIKHSYFFEMQGDHYFFLQQAKNIETALQI